MTPVPELLTTEEVAAVLRCNPRTVARMLAAGEIPAVVNRPALKRFRLADVLEALKSSADPAAAAAGAAGTGPRTVSELYEAHGRGRRAAR